MIYFIGTPSEYLGDQDLIVNAESAENAFDLWREYYDHFNSDDGHFSVMKSRIKGEEFAENAIRIYECTISGQNGVLGWSNKQPGGTVSCRHYVEYIL